MPSPDRRNRLIAIIATVVFHIVVLVIMLCVYLRYTADEPRKWPPQDTSEILYGGELIVEGNMQEQAQSENTPAPSSSPEQADQQAADPVDQGEVGKVPPLVTSTQDSPAKIKETPKPEKTGPTKEELAEQERIKREQEAAQRIRNQVKFGNSGRGRGTAGSPDGNSTVGATGGTPGHTLIGRTLESFGRPKSQHTGTIRIRVRVNRDGFVVGTPTYDGGDGPASANAAVRQSCIAAARESRFSVALNAQAEQVGVITWRFE